MPMFEVIGVMIELIAWPFVFFWRGLQAASQRLYVTFKKPEVLEEAEPLAACPRCRRNLITDPEAQASDDGVEVLYSCSCGDWSRWRVDGKIPVYLGQPI